ncbi:hypothetical protein [Nostocoides veronense]|uniref:Uncharacterized protein n=1 Tax=Nostocoides veronense TaxID=330836 RepID=A0ABN2LYY3_9MICO
MANDLDVHPDEVIAYLGSIGEHFRDVDQKLSGELAHSIRAHFTKPPTPALMPKKRAQRYVRPPRPSAQLPRTKIARKPPKAVVDGALQDVERDFHGFFGSSAKPKWNNETRRRQSRLTPTFDELIPLGPPNAWARAWIDPAERRLWVEAGLSDDDYGANLAIACRQAGMTPGDLALCVGRKGDTALRRITSGESAGIVADRVRERRGA